MGSYGMFDSWYMQVLGCRRWLRLVLFMCVSISSRSVWCFGSYIVSMLVNIV